MILLCFKMPYHVLMGLTYQQVGMPHYVLAETHMYT
jgi:hypothetical protein